MKIAIPAQGEQVNQHFGRSEAFAIFEISDQDVKTQKTVSAAGFQHQHGSLAGLLQQEGVNTVIVGGIGPGAIEALKGLGLNVYTGAQGLLRDVASSFAKGTFVSTKTVCQNHGDHQHH